MIQLLPEDVTLSQIYNRLEKKTKNVLYKTFGEKDKECSIQNVWRKRQRMFYTKKLEKKTKNALENIM